MAKNTAVTFVEVYGGYIGRAADGRRWRITPAARGWLLEFRDRTDTAPTEAGTHRTLADAAAEAGTGSVVVNRSRSIRTSHEGDQLALPRFDHSHR